MKTRELAGPKLRIVSNSDRSKQILEELIHNFGPANSRVFINYAE